MSVNKYKRILALVVILAMIILLGLLVYFLPEVAAVLFVATLIVLAIARGKSKGFWAGIKFFIKEIVFGW